MIQVYISPDYNNVHESKDRGGIRRVVEAMNKHLPKFGINVVHNVNEADVINNHGSVLVEKKGVPSIHTGHGFYWSRQPWGDGYMEVNEQLVESMVHAVAHTAPSNWVANAIRRGGYFYPTVIYHGVDASEFVPSQTHENYVLWNKLRADLVSDPNDMIRLAREMQNTQFQTTIGYPTGNVKVLGTSSYREMKKVVANAGVYLSTVRETFGIGVLEAMAYGVPVVGWNYGGNSEIIRQGETGYLAVPGDYKMLAEMTELAFAERDRLSSNCIEDVRANWGWEKRIEQYANIFKRVYEQWYSPKPKVSVIVTAYKLDAYLPKCLQSVSAQTFKDFECLVIDDANLESTKTIVGKYSSQDARIRYLSTPNNFGLVGARNFGLAHSKSDLIRHVDADDWLAENALELEVTAMDNDRGMHIAYGHLEVVKEDGFPTGQRSGWPLKQFNWYQQMAHMNQLPSCAMVRREVFERSGGYRERMKRQEDAEFWCRVTSLGFRAKKFTEAVTYYHRDRPSSKGAQEWQEQGQEPDWTAWFPWRLGAGDFRSATEVLKKINPVNTQIVPFGAQGKAQNQKFWYVHDYYYPVVSVIVTCGPNHEKYLLDALDSVQAQRFIDWECIVVNDTGKPWKSDLMGAPWAKVVNMEGNQGTAKARNEGFKHAKGKYIIWLDADDFWMPWTLQKMVSYAEQNKGVIFSDFLEKKDDKEPYKLYRYQNFDSSRIPMNMQYSGSSVLYPRDVVQAVFDKQGGYDPASPGMEDFDFQIAVHDLGYCAYHIDEPLFVYRMYSSTKREADYAKIDEIRLFLDKKWSKYRTGKEALMCGCNTPKKPIGDPRSSLSSSGNFLPESVAITGADKSTMVQVQYIGPVIETFTINSRMREFRDVKYRFGNNEYHNTKAVFLGDAEFLLGLIGGNGLPMYRIIGAASNEQQNNPVSFLGESITV